MRYPPLALHNLDTSDSVILPSSATVRVAGSDAREETVALIDLCVLQWTLSLFSREMREMREREREREREDEHVYTMSHTTNLFAMHALTVVFVLYGVKCVAHRA